MFLEQPSSKKDKKIKSKKRIPEKLPATASEKFPATASMKAITLKDGRVIHLPVAPKRHYDGRSDKNKGVKMLQTKREIKELETSSPVTRSARKRQKLFITATSSTASETQEKTATVSETQEKTATITKAVETVNESPSSKNTTPEKIDRKKLR